ncbi:glucosaminidase domain-containing protein [Alicyclobacillus shizuokensis]|uniref:glucosaminidase domain-containing protein n=1 Tax=Alicyclobacillus shizuokensis TaxID=392014 RepID=UPI00082FDA7A|nr:glucosaminidase domain-containing protein [Alicyclobacillus shizuokensis]
MATTVLDDRDALYGALPDHHLRIGDTQFYVPPTAIQVTRRVRSDRINILRGRGSFAKQSGYSDLVVELTLFFPDTQSINNELRPLLAQFMKCPFLPIENTHLNNVHKIEAVTVEGLTVTTTPGFPTTLTATIQLLAFNPWSYLIDQTGRTFDEMINWPLFRWYYQRNLEPSKYRYIRYFEPLTEDLDNSYIFRVASEQDLSAMKAWRVQENKLYQDWLQKTQTTDPVQDIKNEFASDEDFWNKLDQQARSAIFEYDIHMEEWPIPNLHLVSLSASFQNIISTVQLQMHEAPTHQYLGSQDTVFAAVFQTDDEEAIASLQNLVRRSSYLTREYHTVLSNGFLEFDNQLARLFGVHYVIIDDMVVRSVENMPGVFEVTLQMTSYNRMQQRLAETQMIGGNVKWDLGGAFTNSFLKMLTPLTSWSWLQDRPFWKQITSDGWNELDIQKQAVYNAAIREAFKIIEVYPDLELPTYAEVEQAGFSIPNTNGGYFVDPDFFIMYEDPFEFNNMLKDEVAKSYTTVLRDAGGGKAEITPSTANPDEKTQKDIDEKSAKYDNPTSGISSGDPPDTADQKNLSTADMETLIREKAAAEGLDQRFVIAFAKMNDAKLRQFYNPGIGANKELDNITVSDSNIPVMQTADLHYFKDPSLIQEAAYIGVMRVSPLMGDAQALGRSIVYNVTQGVAALKYYLSQVDDAGTINQNVYDALGLDPDKDIQKAKYAAAIALYLGFGREWNDLVSQNKRLPYLLTAKIKAVLSDMDKESKWSSQDLKKKYSALPIADQKAPANTEEDLSAQFQPDEPGNESDYESDDFTFRGMFQDMIQYDRRGRLIRAFPTFFMVFIDEGQYVDGVVKLADHFFGYSAVSDITYTNNRKQASSTLVVEMCNVFGNLTDATKSVDLTHPNTLSLFESLFVPTMEAAHIEQSRDRNSNYYKSIFLRTGARVHFRMGYGSNAAELPTIMNGTVTQLENNGDTVTMIVQDDGVELTNKLKAKPGDSTDGFLQAKKEPSEIIDDLLLDRGSGISGFIGNLWEDFSNKAYYSHSLGIMHFGMHGVPISGQDFIKGVLPIAWLISGTDRDIYEINMNIYKTNGLLNVENDTFWHKLEDMFGIGQGQEDSINITLYDKTVWDVLSVCAYMGPDYILAVHPFEFRSTIFMGKPYFPLNYGYVVDNNKITGTLMKPFRQYHLYDSWTSIIDNSIVASEQNMYTVAIGTFMNEGKLDTTRPIYVDADIWPEKQRTVNVDTQVNAKGIWFVEKAVPFVGGLLNKPFKWYFDEGVAIKIAASALRDYVKDMYDGYLTVMGDPTVKPFDQILIHDEYIDMAGPAEVKEVTQIMSLDMGYVTAIKPDCVVVNSDRKVINGAFSMTATLTPLLVTLKLRSMFRNAGYTGALPIMNAIWAMTKNNMKTLKAKFDATKLGTKLNNWWNGSDMQTYTRKFDMVSKETIERWKKSGLLKKTADTLGSVNAQQIEELLNRGDSALLEKGFWGYDKVSSAAKTLRLEKATSKFVAGGAKAIGMAARFAQAGLVGAEMFAGPIGWIAILVETMAMSLLTATVGEFLKRFLFTRHACLVMPLKKEGIEFTAGLNGHKGSVVGDSPDMWQSLLTNGVASTIFSVFLGVDTSQYGAAGSSNNPVSVKASSNGSSTGSSSSAMSFFEQYRRPVPYDPTLIQWYNTDLENAKKEMSGELQRLDDENKKPDYSDEISAMQKGLQEISQLPSLIKNAISNLASEIAQLISGGDGYNYDGTDFTKIDLNQPSGISAEAIDKAFAANGGGHLKGLGKYFVQLEKQIPPLPGHQAKEGRVMNGLYFAAHAAHESGWGTSQIYRDKHNLFGYGAYDSNPYGDADSFDSDEHCIIFVANKVKDDYLTPGGQFYSKDKGPTLEGMNEKYATDKHWATDIANIMKEIAKLDPNFKWPGTATKVKIDETPPDPNHREKYYLTPAQAKQRLAYVPSFGLKHLGQTWVDGSAAIKYAHKGTLEMADELARLYKQKTGDKLNLTSTYRVESGSWHMTGWAIDIDTPDAPRIGGQVRFPKGSKEKQNLETLIDLAIQVGFGGIIHGDVDVIAAMKKKYPNVVIQQRDDHYNHLHLSYPRG